MANYNSSHTGAEIDSAIGRVKDTAVTAGTISANLGVVVDANKDISGFRNVTLTGQLQAATINLTGDTTIGDGDTDNITINADVNSNIIPNTDNTFDLGSASKQWKDLYVNGIGYIDQLGTDADPIAIYASSGEIDGTAIGSESASTGAFTTLTASGTATFNGTVDINNTSDFGSNAMTNVNIDSGTINGTTITSSVDIVIDTAGKGLADEFGNNILERTAGGYITIGDSAWNEVRLNTTGSTDFVLDNSGNVGIGTTSPSKPLHISSAENQVARFESADAYAGIELKDNGSSTLPPLISALSDDILFYGGNASARPLIMALDSSTGNVGIGTTSPYSLSNYKFLSVSSSTGGGLVCMDDGTVKGGVYNATDDMYYDTTTNHIFRTGASGALSGTERMRIDLNGHIRFGSSGDGFDSAWNSSTYGNTEVAIDGGGGYGVLHFRGDGAGSTNTRYAIGVGDDKFYLAYDDVDARHNIVVDGSGNVGIGTTSPTGLLEVANTSGNADIRIRSSNSGNSRLYFGDVADVGAGFVDYDHGTAMYFGTEGSTRMAINTGGNLIINNNEVGNAGLIRNSSFVSYADDASNSITSGEAGAFMLYAYDYGSGQGACFFCNFSDTVVKVAGHSNWTNSDSDGSFCVFKSASSHTVTVKNRIGSTKNLGVLLVGVNPRQTA